MDRTKRLRLSLILMGISFIALGGCVARRSKAAVRSYTQVLKPGMTRKEVEGYFRMKNVRYTRTWGVPGSNTYSPADLIEIWTFHLPLPCDDQPHYVEFIFKEQTQHPRPTAPQADDLDTLRTITTLDGDIDCF
jgi:hypothetical protein